MQHTAFGAMPQCFGVDDESAIIGANDALHPNASVPLINFHFRDYRDDSLTAERVGNSPPAENISGTGQFRRRAAVPPISLRRSFDYGDGAGALEPAVVGCGGIQEIQTELERIGFSGCGQLVDK